MSKSKAIIKFTFYCTVFMLVGISNAFAADVLETVRNKAIELLLSLKPLIFILAGFGLIGFAWMAIFNKISWKWFSHIAMGLFLVANMGLFIDYFVRSKDSLATRLKSPSYGNYMAASGDYAGTSGTTGDVSEQKPDKEEGTGGPSNSDELDNFGNDHAPEECPEGSKIVGGKCVPDETPKA